MAGSRGTLFEDKTLMKREIIRNLEQTNQNAEEYLKLLTEFKQKLAVVASIDDFYVLVEQIADLLKKTHVFVDNNINSKEMSITSEIREYINNHPELNNILLILDYKDINNDIVATNERLEAVRGLSGLNPDQQAAFTKATKALSINALKEVVALIDSFKDDFQEQLKQAGSEDEVQSIEQEIDMFHHIIEGFYQQMIPFPQDEAVAGALIQYVESNLYLHDMIRRFDFNELLMDDVIRARVNILDGGGRFSPGA